MKSSRIATQSTQYTNLKFALTAIAALAAGNAAASATQFTATATVQNAVAITQTTPMNFGTVFATATSVPAAGADATYSQTLTISPAGVASAQNTAAAGTPGKLLSLGGSVAGVFTAPGLPPSQAIGVRLTDSNGSLLFANTPAATATCTYDTPALAIAAHKVVLVNGADPTVGFFCVTDFQSNRLALLSDGVTPPASGVGYSLGFGVTTLTFNLGATLVTQAPVGTVGGAAAHLYQPGTYTGTFGMEVIFP